MTAASVRGQRGLGGSLLLAGAYILATSSSHMGSVQGALIGFGASGATLGLLLLWLSIVTKQHMSAPPAYWQAVQDRWRSRVLWGQALGGTTLLIVAAIAAVWKAFAVAAGLATFGGVMIAIAVLMVTGGIRPIRYE